jgi:two-component system chemotaxis response regulator CheY
MSGQTAVLIVDDDPFIRELIVTTLEDVTQFELHQAADGAEALTIAADVHPRLVFLDIDMPTLDGIGTCRALRSDPNTATATIVMLTASAEDASRRRAEDAGADLFLTKPFSPLNLLRMVDSLSE